jgi:hypothetical protein
MRRNIPVDDLFLYARSFHQAVKALAEFLLVGGNPVSDVDFSPVVSVYRLALELYLKALVLGDGGNFLETKPDLLTVHKTHSVSWLAQFVAQIVTKLGWQKEFRCLGVENLDDFKSLVESVNSVDPGSYTYRCFVDPKVEFNAGEFREARRADLREAFSQERGRRQIHHWQHLDAQRTGSGRERHSNPVKQRSDGGFGARLRHGCGGRDGFARLYHHDHRGCRGHAGDHLGHL